MFLLPVLAGILLFLPGPECYVAGLRNAIAAEAEDQEYEQGILNKIRQLEKILYEKKRRYELSQRLLQDAFFPKRENDVDIPADDEVVYVPNAVETDKDEFVDVRNGDLDLTQEEIDNLADPTPSKEELAKDVVDDDTYRNYTDPQPPQKHIQASDTVLSGEHFQFLVIVTAASVAGLIGLIFAGLCWYKLHKKVKAASDVDYPAYGVTGPTKERLPSPGDRKLAQSAQMYHYQHQKQQMIAMEKANGEMKQDASEDESEEENEEGDYTVYECPGLAPTGEMEVRNPLFTGDAQTPVNGDPNANNGLHDDHHDN